MKKLDHKTLTEIGFKPMEGDSMIYTLKINRNYRLIYESCGDDSGLVQLERTRGLPDRTSTEIVTSVPELLTTIFNLGRESMRREINKFLFLSL